VLLVTFMVVTPLFREEIATDLPEAEHAGSAGELTQVTLSLLRSAFADRPDKSIFLESDRSLTERWWTPWTLAVRPVFRRSAFSPVTARRRRRRRLVRYPDVVLAQRLIPCQVCRDDIDGRRRCGHGRGARDSLTRRLRD